MIEQENIAGQGKPDPSVKTYKHRSSAVQKVHVENNQTVT